MLNEEPRSFEPEWLITNNLSSLYSQSIRDVFIYRTSSELDSYVYVGKNAVYGSGGYLYQYRGRLIDLTTNLSMLRELSWIDLHTRAIIIQLNLYNPNVKLYTSATLIVEILSTGGVIPDARFEPVNLYIEYQGLSSRFHFVVALIYLSLIIYLTIKEIRSIIKQKKQYFYNIWSYIDFGIIGCSLAGVSVCTWHYHEAIRIGKLFVQTNLDILIVKINKCFHLFFGKLNGSENANDEDVYEDRGSQMRTQYRERIDLFSERIDQLMIALNKLYVSYPKSLHSSETTKE